MTARQCSCGRDHRHPEVIERQARLEALLVQPIPSLLVGANGRVLIAGDWPRAVALHPGLLAHSHLFDLTGEIRVRTDNGYATYRVEGVNARGEVVGTLTECFP